MAADLLRFLAKRGRLEVIQYLQRKQRGLTINELARCTGIPLATTWHSVQDLRSLGLVFVDRIGSGAVVTVNRGSPVWATIRRLMALDLTGPHRQAYDYFVRRLRTRTPRVGVRLFGSVSRDTHKPSSDVDVEVTYGGTGHSRATVQDACNKASNEVLDRFRMPVVAVVSKQPVMDT